MKRQFLIIIGLLLLAATVVQAQLLYTTNAGSLTVTGYSGPNNANVTIPTTISGLQVTSIGASAFQNSNLRSVLIPTTVTNIGEMAFAGCNGLSSITIPGSVISIGDEAFQNCVNLGEDGITINDGVKSIGDYAFEGLDELSSIIIPASVTSLGDRVFEGCDYMTSVTIQGGSINIGQYVFLGCFSLTNATIANGVQNIGYGEFAGCTRLTGVTIPGSVTNIGEAAFNNCTTLTAVTILSGVTSIGDYAFLGCSSLYDITIPNTLISIGEDAFQGCLMSSITIPGSVTNIVGGAFGYCGDLISVYFTGNNPYANISYPSLNIFPNDSGITVYYLTNTTGWGSTLDGYPTELWSPPNPYVYTTNAGSITITGYAGSGGAIAIPSAINGLPVTSIAANAFISCPSLTSVTIPATVTNMGYGAFLGDTSLANVVIANGVTSIGAGAFIGCTSLSSVSIPNSVVAIGEDAFADCASLTNQIIPSSVTNIGEYAFQDCYGLTSVYFEGNAPAADLTVFLNDNNATVYYLSSTTGWGSSFAGILTAQWLPQIESFLTDFGMNSNQFGFKISWASGQVVEVETCTNLVSPNWLPFQTTTLTNGNFYFSDPLWRNYPARFFRVIGAGTNN